MPSIYGLVGWIWPKASLRKGIRLFEAGRPATALKPLRRAAEAGLAEASYWIGVAYLRGAGVPISRLEAAKWLEHAAAQGHAEAQALLATLFLHGYAGPGSLDPEPRGGGYDRLFAVEKQGVPDFSSALHWASLAAECPSSIESCSGAAAKE